MWQPVSCERSWKDAPHPDSLPTLSPDGRGNYSVLITSRPAYWPQLGQIVCGRLGFLQLGQGWSWTRASARCERRRPFLDFDCLTFGSAMPAEFYRKRPLAYLSSQTDPFARALRVGSFDGWRT